VALATASDPVTEKLRSRFSPQLLGPGGHLRRDAANERLGQWMARLWLGLKPLDLEMVMIPRQDVGMDP